MRTREAMVYDLCLQGGSFFYCFGPSCYSPVEIVKPLARRVVYENLRGQRNYSVIVLNQIYFSYDSAFEVLSLERQVAVRSAVWQLSQ